MPATVVIGAQWGDEGKGKITDLLADKADVVCRYQGGNNAGHTIVRDGEVFALHLTVALEAAHKCDAAAQQVSDLEELIAESRLLSAMPDPGRIWRQLLVSASHMTSADVCAVLLVDGAPRRRQDLYNYQRRSQILIKRL